MRTSRKALHVPRQGTAKEFLEQLQRQWRLDPHDVLSGKFFDHSVSTHRLNNNASRILLNDSVHDEVSLSE